MKAFHTLLLLVSLVACSAEGQVFAQTTPDASPFGHIDAVQTGNSIDLRILLIQAGVLLSRADLLNAARVANLSYQTFLTLPITQVELINPSDGSVLAVFTKSDLN